MMTTTVLALTLLALCPIRLHASDYFLLDNGIIHLAVRHWLDEPSSAAAKYGPIESWDTSRVTDMHGLFRYAQHFNEDISQWNTSRVTSLRETFYRAESFNSDISNWNTSNVRDMSYAFGGAFSFNGDLQGWDTSQVTTMKGVFYEAEAFDQDISRWDVAKVKDFRYSFSYAYTFSGKGNLSSWNVSSAASMVDMFHFARSFDQEVCWPSLLSRPGNLRSEEEDHVDLTNMFCESLGRFSDTCSPLQSQYRYTWDCPESFDDFVPGNNTLFFGVIMGWMCFLLLILGLVIIYRYRTGNTTATDTQHDKGGIRSSDGRALMMQFRQKNSAAVYPVCVAQSAVYPECRSSSGVIVDGDRYSSFRSIRMDDEFSDIMTQMSEQSSTFVY